MGMVESKKYKKKKRKQKYNVYIQKCKLLQSKLL